MTFAALVLGVVLYDPPPGDAGRLPPLADLKDGRLFNQRYRAHLLWRLEYEPDRTGELRAALAEAAWLYWHVWDAAEGAHPDYRCPPEARACYSRKLRLAIGPSAYLRGELPPCVPYHRFNQLKW